MKRFSLTRCMIVLCILIFSFACETDEALPDSDDDVPPLTQAIIIDHACTATDAIPQNWLSQVCSLFRIHYAHTSHGEQITVGMERLSNRDALYPLAIDFCRLPSVTGRLNLLDGQVRDSYCETYVTPDLYWETAEGLALTRSVLSHFAITISGWMWCTQLDDYTSGQTQQYLDAMNLLEKEFPNIRFIYFTGNAQSPEMNRVQRNDQIRAFCRANRKVLFDFADLDCWYAGGQHMEGGIPMEHPRYHGDEAGHTTFESCENKARAFWWLLARLAGWNGS